MHLQKIAKSRRSKLQLLLASSTATVALSSAVDAHVLWINVTPGEESGRTVMTSIGYGNVMPSEDILVPDWGPIDIEQYDIIAPDRTRSSLGVPKLAATKKNSLPSGAVWQEAGDLGMRKLTLGPRTASGTYQLVGRTPVVPVTYYRDKQGQELSSDKPPKSIKDLAQVISTTLEVNYMKSAFAVDKWSEVEPIGHALEIVPVSDLHTAQPGSVVRFKVLFNGKPLTEDAMPYVYVTATSPGFGARWSLHSELEEGEGEFRLPSPGGWRIDVRFHGPAAAVEELKNHTPGANALLETTFAFYLTP